MTVKLPIERDGELLKKYGLASALFASTDYLLGEMIRFNGGLHKANQNLVNDMLDKKTFGYKFNLSKNLIANEELISKLEQAVSDRNTLAHGVSVEQNGKFKLMHSKGFQDLSSEKLDEIIERTRVLAEDIIKEIQKNFKLIS